MAIQNNLMATIKTINRDFVYLLTASTNSIVSYFGMESIITKNGKNFAILMNEYSPIQFTSYLNGSSSLVVI